MFNARDTTDFLYMFKKTTPKQWFSLVCLVGASATIEKVIQRKRKEDLPTGIHSITVRAVTVAIKA